MILFPLGLSMVDFHLYIKEESWKRREEAKGNNLSWSCCLLSMACMHVCICQCHHFDNPMLPNYGNSQICFR